MGVRGALSDPDERSRAAAPPRPARGLQRPALDRAGRLRPGAICPTTSRPGQAVYQQTQRWIGAGCFEAMVHDLRELLRWSAGRAAQPTAVIFDSATRQSTPESGHRAGYDGHKRRKGPRSMPPSIRWATCWRCWSPRPMPRTGRRWRRWRQDVQRSTGQTVELAFVDQGYTGEKPAAAAQAHGIRLEVVKLAEAKRGFVLLPRRWVVERSFAWAARFRRLAKDYERLPETVAGLHFVAFACLMLHRLVTVAAQSP